MKKIISLIVFTISFYFIQAQNVPTYKNIITQFFKSYSYDYSGGFLKFQKKKDGWHVVIENPEKPNTFLSDEIFWPISKKIYSKINFTKDELDTDSLENKIDTYFRYVDGNNTEYFFDRNLYFGYPGWDWDVIMTLEKQTNLSDSLLESLARAYSNYSVGFLYDQYGDLFVNNDSDRVVLPKAKQVSKSRISKFIYYDEKAINTYDKLVRLNPNFETKVGNVQLKRANESLFLYSTLKSVGESTNAKNALKNVKYPDSLISLSKKILAQVQQKGILITGGDNDTYPLWYLQEVENYRPDITVLNSSLLGLERYLLMLEKEFKSSLFKTPSSFYLSADLYYYEKSKKVSEPMFVSDFIAKLIKSNNQKERLTEEKVITKYNASKLVFDLNINKNEKFSINLSKYLFLNQLIMIDIANKQLLKRPVYFTYPEELFNSFLIKKGDLFKIPN